MYSLLKKKSIVSVVMKNRRILTRDVVSFFFSGKISGTCLKTGQHSIFVIIRKIKKIIHVCWIPYLLMIL